MLRSSLCVALSCAVLAAVPAWADEAPQELAAPTAAASPWDAELAAFASGDRAKPPAADGILFVGSSSIRLWSNLESQFGGSGVVLKRGFGGSQLSDCVKHLNRLVVQYKPRMVLVYAGDNDLAAGVPPEEVLRRFEKFVAGVRRDLPAARIAYISIKPSPSRASLMPQIRTANALIRTFIGQRGDVDYIDVYTPMLDATGAPRGELFREDALHLNADGYALWQRIIAPFVG